jgi:TPR repeat protein
MDCVVCKTQNPEGAKYYFQKAADAGNTYGMCALADLYEKGCDIPPDHKKARELYKKAADAGNPEAMQALGRLPAE